MAVQADHLCFENMGFGSFAVCGSQDWFLGSGLGIEDGFCFQELQPNDNQKKEIQGVFDNQAASSSTFSCSGSLSMEFLQCLYSEVEKQKLEMEWFLQLENERLRSVLQEATRQQAVLLQKYFDSRIKILMLQKDEELAIARKETMELQDFLKRAEMEAKAWETKATEKEATVFDLNNRLIQAREKECLFPNAAKEADAISFCDSSPSSTRKQETEEHSKKIACKMCQDRSLCVVFFPCKHLCCCKFCEPLLWHCPVCETVKESSLEVFLGPENF